MMLGDVRMNLFRKHSADYMKSIRFYKYFFSYVGITIMLLIILGAAVNGNLIASIKKRVEVENTSSLSQIMSMMDLRLKEMERIAFQISANFRLSASIIEESSYNSLQANKELKNYSAANAFVYDIGLFYKNRSKETMYASSGIYDLDYFFSKEYRFETFTKQAFLSKISSLKTPHMLPMQAAKLLNLTQTAFAVYLYPLTLNSEHSYGVVAYLIDEKALSGMISRIIAQYRGYIYILDEHNTPIISLNADEAKYEKKQMIESIDIESVAQGVSTLKVKNEDYSIVKLTSDYNHWSYVTVVPTKMFMQSVDDSKRLFWIVVLTVLLLGLFMAYFFAIQNYKPWGRLVNLIQGQEGTDSLYSRNRDEVAFITNAVSKVTDENKNLMTRLKSRSGMIRDQVLMSLLKGRIDSLEGLDLHSDMAELRLNKPYFSVVLFLIDDYPRFSAENTKAMQDLFKFSMINMAEELANEFGSGYGMDLLNENGIAVILNLSDDKDYTGIRDLVLRAKEFYSHHFRFTLTAGIGTISDDIRLIQKSFVEASRAASYRMIQGSDSVIFYTEIPEHSLSLKYHYPTDLEQDLITAIKHGRLSEIEPLLLQIRQSIVSQEISPVQAQLICSGIRNTILKLKKESGLEFHVDHDMDLAELFSRDFETLAVFEAHMIELCRRICAAIENSRESKNFLLRDRILQYVAEHYTDSNLSLNSIAELFEVTPSYLTRYFKDQTGYPMMQYLDMVRMGKVKEELRSSNLKIKDIITRNGYVDETNFIRKFKKNEGVTPLQYRNQIK